jgi:hypothetical protein
VADLTFTRRKISNREALARFVALQLTVLLDEGHCFRHNFTSLDVKDIDEMNKADRVPIGR